MTATEIPDVLAAAAGQVLEAATPPDPLAWLDDRHATPPPVDHESARPFGLRLAGEVAADVDAMPPPTWLWRRVWPADAYGVLGAGWKVGKTWLVIDAAVAAASGTPWLGLFDTDRTGPVVLFLGEGGARKMTRRGRAVAAHHGQRWDDLPIHLSERVPTLTSTEQIAELAREVHDIRPVLVVVDPLYLAAGGADGAKLYGMGEVLSPIQRVCQTAGSALLIAHHHNRSRGGSGSERMSGAGPAEWGRVLVSIEKKAERIDQATARTDVHLELTIEGDEVAGGAYRFRRQVWADDADVIGSPLHYEVSPIEGDDPATDPGPAAGMAPSGRRVLAVLTAGTDWMTAREIGDVLAEDGHGPPLKRRTIQNAAGELVDAGLALVHSDGAGTASSWKAAG